MISTEYGGTLNLFFNGFYQMNMNLANSGYTEYAKNSLNEFYMAYPQSLTLRFLRALEAELKRTPSREVDNRMFQDLWIIMKAYVNGPDDIRTDDYWRQLMGHASAFYSHYKSAYAYSLISSFIDEVEAWDRVERKNLGLSISASRNVMTG